MTTAPARGKVETTSSESAPCLSQSTATGRAESWPQTQLSCAELGRLAYDLPIGNQHPDKRQSRRNSTMRLLRWLQSWPGDSWQARWENSAAELQGKNWREPGIDELLAAEEMSRFAARRHFTVGMSCLISLQVLRPGYDWLIPTTSPTPTGTCGRWSRRSSSPGRMPGPSETASANASASTRSTTSAAS